MKKSEYEKQMKLKDGIIRALQAENDNLRKAYSSHIREYNEAKKKYQTALDNLKAWKTNYEKDMQNFLDNFIKNTDEKS